MEELSDNGSEWMRPHRYRERVFCVTYFNSSRTCPSELKLHRLNFRSSATDPKHLKDIAVRFAKERNRPWTSFVVYSESGEIVATRISRKAKK